MAKTKFGEGHVEAMARLGLKELRNAFNPSRESVADSELGLYGTQTQGEIADARSPEQETMSMDELRAEAKQKAQGNEKGKDGPDKDGPDQERGRER